MQRVQNVFRQLMGKLHRDPDYAFFSRATIKLWQFSRHQELLPWSRLPWDLTNEMCLLFWHMCTTNQVCERE